VADPIGYVIVESCEGQTAMLWSTGFSLVKEHAVALAEDQQRAADQFVRRLRYTVAAVVPAELWERLNRRLDDLVENPLGELM
jgi:hypothetical protein